VSTFQRDPGDETRAVTKRVRVTVEVVVPADEDLDSLSVDVMGARSLFGHFDEHFDVEIKEVATV